MILDLALNKDKTLLFSASVDMLARSWLPEVGGEAKVFEGGERSITLLVLKGQTRESCLFFREKREMNLLLHTSSVPNREYCQGIHVGYLKNSFCGHKVLLFSLCQIGVCLPFENGSAIGKKGSSGCATPKENFRR